MGLALETSKLAKTIEGLHAMLAVGAKAPLLKISPQEAAMLAEGVKDVSEQFDVPVNAKVVAIMNLFGAASAVYVPRMFMAWAMMQQKKKAPPMNTNDGSANAGLRVVPQPNQGEPPSDGKIKFD